MRFADRKTYSVDQDCANLLAMLGLDTLDDSLQSAND